MTPPKDNKEEGSEVIEMKETCLSFSIFQQ
jgi:hypothetical protein